MAENREDKTERYVKRAAAGVAAGGAGLLVRRGMTFLGFAAGGPAGALVGAAVGSVVATWVAEALDEIDM
ncbi:hypothetical protein [Streptomyces sioyaensis]|uniref:hypothetical protein n=1 Tax=Streptomyces sioyaensis TaxID=67364 RepID=UPI00378C0883